MLTGLELMFMGVTWSNSGLFSTPGFVVLPVGERERRGEKMRRDGRGKGLEKERNEGRRNKKCKGWKEEEIKKERRTERKKEFRGKGGKKKKCLLLPLNLSLIHI